MDKNKTKNFQFLSSFWIKVIALLTMTIDHIGVFLPMYGIANYDSSLYLALRAVGRIALPLFVFLLIEGINHTKHLGRYILRMSIGLVIVLIPFAILDSQGFGISGNNPFFDLLLVGLFFSFLKMKGWKKIFAIFPLAYICLSTTISIIDPRCVIEWFPRFLRCGYGIYALLLGGGYELATLIANLKVKDLCKEYDASLDDMKQTSYYNFIKTMCAVCFLVIVNVVMWLVFNNINKDYDYLGMSFQCYSILAGIPIALYSGKLGYNKKWFKYGSYLYFDIHIAILYVIFQLACVGTLF